MRNAGATSSQESSSPTVNCAIKHIVDLSKADFDLDKFAFDGGSISIGETKERSHFKPPPLDCEIDPIDPNQEELSCKNHFASKHSRSSDDGSQKTSKKRKKSTLDSPLDISAKRQRSSDWKTKDITVHDRKSAWVDAYGDARIAKCFICQFNEVGWENVGFDMAHVVARARGGNNDETWNRVPVCGTCNKNVSSETNLLDFVAQFYPKRLIPVVFYLWNRFRHRNSFIADEYFSQHGLEAFVRTMYGCCGIQVLPTSTFGKYLQRQLGPVEGVGLIQNKKVYAIVRSYDQKMKSLKNSKQQLKQLNRELDALDLLLDRLKNLKAQENEKIKNLQASIEQLCES